MRNTTNKRSERPQKDRNRFNRNKKRNNTRKKQPSTPTYDLSKLVKRASADVSDLPKFNPSYSYDELSLSQSLKVNLSKKGFKHPTQIQEESLEYLLQGRDIVGIANTGTGKTGAFLIPIIEQLLNNNKNFSTLVIVPTRELAMQVMEEFRSLTHGMGLYSSCFIGGTSLSKDISQIRRKNHLIIGTPGRLIDLIERGAFKIKNVSKLVLDEFDRMLDMGFVNDIMKMINQMPNRNQTMLFSATVDKTQKKLIADILNDPIEIKVCTGVDATELVDQDIIKLQEGQDKFSALLDVMSQPGCEKALIFTETKHLADKITKRLTTSGVKSDQIHGNKSQNYRMNALQRFKKGKIKVLVATDVAARGIDVSDITHVINYQIPINYDSYVHRIGRTGRAGKTGKALTFVD